MEREPITHKFTSPLIKMYSIFEIIRAKVNIKYSLLFLAIDHNCRSVSMRMRRVVYIAIMLIIALWFSAGISIDKIEKKKIQIFAHILF